MSAAPYLIAGVFGFLLSLSTQALAEPMSVEEQARFRELDARPLHKLVNVELAEYLRLRTKSWAGPDGAPSPAEELGRLAVKAIDQPNRLFSVRFDLSESDRPREMGSEAVSLRCSSVTRLGGPAFSGPKTRFLGVPDHQTVTSGLRCVGK